MADDDTHENKRRCTTTAKEELKRILKEKDVVNTRRTTDSSVKTFRAYLRKKMAPRKNLKICQKKIWINCYPNSTRKLGKKMENSTKNLRCLHWGMALIDTYKTLIWFMTQTLRNRIKYFQLLLYNITQRTLIILIKQSLTFIRLT